MKNSAAVPTPSTRAQGDDRSLNELAYNCLKDALITLVYKPGEYLNTALLMSHFGLGRTPVHQALHRLAAEGLVQIIPRKGAVATPLSIQDALELIDVRLVNETLCMRLAAGVITDDEVQQLQAMATQVEAAASKRDMTALMNSDRMFHEMIAQASRNSTLRDILSVLHARSQRFWAASLSSDAHVAEVLAEHRSILSTLARHDKEAAAEAAKTHILSFKHALLNTPR